MLHRTAVIVAAVERRSAEVEIVEEEPIAGSGHIDDPEGSAVSEKVEASPIAGTG